MPNTRRQLLVAPVGLLAALTVPAAADNALDLIRSADRALGQLYANQPKARELGERAVGILVFPRIIKAGFVIGGQSGNGVLREHGRLVAYYNISAASFGLQAGAQAFGYALFFMNRAALGYLNRSDGWSVGSGPSIVVIDKGAAASFTTTTLTEDVYAFPFAQQGLMAGLGIEGSKITRIHLS